MSTEHPTDAEQTPDTGTDTDPDAVDTDGPARPADSGDTQEQPENDGTGDTGADENSAGRATDPNPGGESGGSEKGESARSGSPRIVVATPEALAMSEDKEGNDPTAVVEEPAKVMRLGSMIKQLLEEVRSAPLDEAARERLAEIHERSLHELESGLSEELVAELHRITLPFNEKQTPSDAELRIAQAQLVGWLEGLFHGIQTALVAQQMAAQNQLVQMRKALPPGVSAQGAVPPGLVVNRADDQSSDRGTGQYL